MDENKYDELEDNVLDTPSENESEELEENESEELEENELDTLKSRLAELESENTKYKRIAQQKEKKLQQAKETAQPVQLNTQSTLAPKDLIALSRSGYDDEVLEEALEYAKFKKIEVREALNSNFIKAMANEREEFKRTSEATAGKSNRASSKGRDETLLANSIKGIIPDNDDDITKLAQLRMKKR